MTPVRADDARVRARHERIVIPSTVRIASHRIARVASPPNALRTSGKKTLNPATKSSCADSVSRTRAATTPALILRRAPRNHAIEMSVHHSRRANAPARGRRRRHTRAREIRAHAMRFLNAPHLELLKSFMMLKKRSYRFGSSMKRSRTART